MEIDEMSEMLSDDQVFDHAYMVRFMDELIYVWNGAHTVNVYTSDKPGKYINTDVFSVGDFAQDKASLEEVLVSISEYNARAYGDDDE